MIRRGLFVLFEGLPETVIDSQVLVHVREMRERGIVDFQVWGCAGTSELYRQSLTRVEAASRLSGATVRVLRCATNRPSMPASTFLNAVLLERHLRRIDPPVDLIHARTDYAASVCSHLKRWREFDLVWDCRGDCVAEFRATYEGWRDPISLLRRDLGTVVLKRRLRRAAAACDRAIFVSDALREVAGFSGGEIIPCAASERLFFFDPALRRATRQRLRLAERAIVLVYSGSLAPYQCFRETVALFRRLHERDPRTALLFLTPRAEAVRAVLGDFPAGAVRLHSAPVEEVNAYLNAADFGVMLRRNHPVNRAASPTKFAEYCLAGLPILLNPGVTATYPLARELDLAVDCPIDGEAPELEQPDLRQRAEAADRARGRLSRAAILPRYQKIYGFPSEPAPAVAAGAP